MNRRELIELIKKKKSFLCVGLDTDKAKIPTFLLKEEDPLFAFNKAIIDATIDLAVAYKPNLAFYESEGLDAMRSLRRTMQYLQERSAEVFTIADAKRGDIGNTSTRYAKAFLDPEGELNFDSVTVAPYMGEDSVKPFLSYPNKWVILLALTSNQGAFDFQFFEEKGTGKLLFEKVLEVSKSWGSEENMMYVVGATKAEMLGRVRSIVKDHFLLVPGVGAQGGSLEEVCRYGMTSDCGLLVNASRSILYASSDSNFAEEARKEAYLMQQAMEKQIQERM